MPPVIRIQHTITGRGSAVTNSLPLKGGRVGVRGCRVRGCLVWVFFLLLFLISSCSDEAWNGVTKGSHVPEFSLSTAEGDVITDASLKGKIYLITFFNTACKDCQHELPVVQQIYDKYKYDIRFLNVARGQSATDVQSYWDTNGLSMPYHCPSGTSMYSLFAQTGIPRLYLIDANGEIVASYDDSNMPTFDTLSQQIDRCIAGDDHFVDVNLKACVRADEGIALLSDNFYFYNEYAVNKLYVYFYDSSTKKLMKQVILSNLTKLDDVPGMTYDISYLCNTIKLSAGHYDIFCVANTDYAPQDIEDEDEFLNTIDSLSYSEGVLSSISDKGAIMTNTASDNLDVDLYDAAKVHSTITINLERVLAKVRIGCRNEKFELEHDGEKYADINITNYKLVNLNTAFYLFRHTAELSSFTPPEQYTLEENFAEDYEKSGSNTYVLDPYFFDKKTDAASLNAMAEKYSYPFLNYRETPMAPMPAVNNYGAAYLLENTCYSASQVNGYSAGVIFKGAVNPVFVYLFDANTNSLQKESRIEYWPLKLYFWNYNFYGSLRALNIASGLNIDELRTYTDAQLRQYGVKQTDFNMGVYETYYTYWIRHNTSDTSSRVMKYGIVRNNFYQLLITGITGIGNSIITPNLAQDNDDNSYSDEIVTSMP